MLIASAPRPKPGRRFLAKAGIAVAMAGLVLGSVQIVRAHFFTNGPSGATSTFSAGSVSLTSSTTGHCAVTNMFPGSAPSPCTLTATYSGTVTAILGLDVLIEAQSGIGGTRLYNPTDGAHDLHVAISSTSPSVMYTVPATVTGCPTGAPSGSTCYELDDELVAASVAPSSTVTFTTTVSLPSGTTTGYRGGAAQIILTGHATQAGNNSTSGCTFGPGKVCTSVNWS